MFDREILVSAIRRLSLEAGEVIMEIYDRDEFDVKTKSDTSPVTEADEAADNLIAAGLRKQFPDIPIVTEEQAATHDLDAQTFLIVDPLDGTKEFVKRRGDFTVNIALVENGVPSLGVVYAPAKRRMFYAISRGAVLLRKWHRSIRILPRDLHPISVANPDNTALNIVASKSHRDQATDDYINRYRVAESVSAGSSLKFCLVATGEADFYPRLGPTMEWDTAAGHAVLKAAGGEVLEKSTHSPLRYGKPGFRNPHFLALAPGVNLVAE